MKRLKSYLVLLPCWYKIIMFAALPLVLLVGNAFMLNTRMDGMVGTGSLLCFLEIVLDHWLFGGIQSKNAVKMDYLKSSDYGMTLMKNGLWLDQLRRLAEILLLLLACLGEKVASGQNADAGNCIVMVLSVYVTAALGVLLTRFGENIWLHWILGYGFMLCFILLYLICCANIKRSILILGILAFGVMIVSVKVAEKKIREGYYDERIKNRD